MVKKCPECLDMFKPTHFKQKYCKDCGKIRTREGARKFAKEHREERLKYHKTWVAKQGGEPYYRLRFEILKRDNFRCQYCGRSVKDGVILEVDHIDPRNGNKNMLYKANSENLITACRDCNKGKSNRELSKEQAKFLRR
jgi:5-methylcytosine-specific restriction endonuclease McrA